MLDVKLTIDCRIFENQHLLDATEIFRKLNVHKKVFLPFLSASMTSNPLINPSGVVLQVGVPLGDVLFLSILDDSGPYKGRSKLIARGGKQNHETWEQYWASGSLNEKRMRPSQENTEDSVDMIVHWVNYTRDESCTVYE